MDVGERGESELHARRRIRRPGTLDMAMLLLGFAGLGYAGYRKTRSDNALA
jgi:hypothetical protein